MHTTLLESKSHRTRNPRGTLVSVVVHSAIISAAVYATAAGSPTPEPVDDIPKLVWFPMSKTQPHTPSTNRSSPSRSAALPHTIAVPIDIPSTLPAIDVSANPVTAADLGPASNDSSHSVGSSQHVAPGPRAYESFEVETPVSSLGTYAPEYPGPLRASGIEGRVSAQFVVNERGRVEMSSLEVLSATNDLFVESVRRALPRMRFKPARIGSQAVAQLVRQEFAFVLDR
jgi:protein TonB